MPKIHIGKLYEVTSGVDSGQIGRAITFKADAWWKLPGVYTERPKDWHLFKTAGGVVFAMPENRVKRIVKGD